jgi:hypothetical protein
MSLHVSAAIHCSLGRHADAIPVVQHAVAVVKPLPPPAEGEADDQRPQQEPEAEQIRR